MPDAGYAFCVLIKGWHRPVPWPNRARLNAVALFDSHAPLSLSTVSFAFPTSNIQSTCLQ